LRPRTTDPACRRNRLAELGQRGHRLDESKSGAGLGLAIALEIVRLNNGKIEFQKASIGGLAVWLTAAAATG